MALTLSILFAASAAVLAGLVLKAIFKSLDPAKVEEYRPCKGGWWEGKLNNCQARLEILKNLSGGF